MGTKMMNRLFTALFMLALMTPAAFTDPTGGGVSEQENRVLARRPGVAEIRESPSAFLERFGSWFSDNVGFRERLIRLHQRLNRRLESREVQYADGHLIYLIGERGHHYYAGAHGELIPKYQGKSVFSDADLQALAARLNEINDGLDQKNIPLIVMLCADKESVYPEYYPRSIMRGPEPIQLDIITDYLQEHTSADVFNIRQCLVDQKQNFSLYNKGDGDLIHYNERGAFFSYLELMRHIQAYYPGARPFALDDVAFYNDANDVEIKTDVSYKALNAGFFDEVTLIRPFDWENFAFENSDASRPTILVMRDSYAGKFKFLARYLPEHFSRTILIHYDNMNHFEDYVAFFQPDIVVFEAAERQLNLFADRVIQSGDFR